MDMRGVDMIFSYDFLKKYIAIFIFVLSLIFIFFIFWNYLIPYFMPFIISYAISLAVSPLRRRFDDLGIKRWMSGAMFTFIIYFGVGGVLWYAVRSLLHQLYDLALAILRSPESLTQLFSRVFGELSMQYPKVFANVDFSLVQTKIVEKFVSLSEHIVGKLASMALSVPSVLLFLFAMILSTYYFIRSEGGKFAKIKKLIPKTILASGYYAKRIFKKYMKQYFTSMIVMLGIVFGILVLGFYVLNIKYFLLLAFVISLIDMLPVLGVGTVLVPWGIYKLMSGDAFCGIGLLVIYVLILFIRQIVEAHLLGKKTGLSPLITLMAIYIGYSAFGLLGAIFSPLAAMIVSTVLSELVEIKEEM